MTDKDKARLALLVISGAQRRLDKEQIDALVLVVDPNAPYTELHLGDNDFAWRGECDSGPLTGQPFKVDPDDVKTTAVDLLLSVMEEGCLFARKPDGKATRPTVNPKHDVEPQLIKPPTKIANRRK